MAREQIRRMVEDSKGAVRKEQEDAARAVRDEIGGMKKSTLEKI